MIGPMLAMLTEQSVGRLESSVIDTSPSSSRKMKVVHHPHCASPAIVIQNISHALRWPGLSQLETAATRTRIAPQSQPEPITIPSCLTALKLLFMIEVRGGAVW